MKLTVSVDDVEMQVFETKFAKIGVGKNHTIEMVLVSE